MLNVGPDPNGEWDTAAYTRLREIGEWMKINGEAIYNTIQADLPIYNAVYFTQKKDTSAVYILKLIKEDDQSLMNGVIFEITDLYKNKFKHIQILGTKIILPIKRYQVDKGVFKLKIEINDGNAIKELRHAAVFKLIK